LKYNLGFFRNLKEIFGENIFLWWIPIYFYNDNNNDNKILKGYSHEINYDICNIFISNDESKSFHTSKNNFPTDDNEGNDEKDDNNDIDNHYDDSHLSVKGKKI
jgi:hypothetical protein